MLKFINRFEDWYYQQSVQKRLLYIGFGIIFLAIFALNYFFPIYCDDMMYSVVKYGQSVNLGENISEISSFMYTYYFEWGGRVVAHIVAHILLLFNIVGQDILNSLVYCILIYLAYQICQGKNKSSLFVFIFLAISFFYFTPSFLSSAVWKTGSANYLWMIALTLAFILPYHKLYDGKEYKDTYLRSIAFFFFGIIASWTNENTGPTLFIIITAYIASFYFFKNKQIPRWAIVGIVGVIVGCCLMILAPGNAVRAESEGHAGLFNSFGKMGERLQYIGGSYRHFMLRPIIIYVLCMILYHFYAKDKSEKKNILLQSLIFFVAANISIWLTILAPSFPPRAFMSITVLTIVSIGILYANIDLRRMMPRIVNICCLAALIFYASFDYMTFLKGVYFLDKEMTKREAVIDEVKARGERKIEFESIYMDYRFEYSDFANYYKDYYDVDVEFVDK